MNPPPARRRAAAVLLPSMLSLVLTAGGCTAAPDPSPDRWSGRSGEPSERARDGRPARVLHVAIDGSDRADGTRSAPLRSIGAAISRADRNDTIVVGAGSYHESLKIESRPGLTLTAAPGAEVWLDGSRRIEKWTDRGRLWSADWDVHFDHSPTYTFGAPDYDRPGWRFVSDTYPMAAHPDQLWIDGVRQRQVADRDAVREGSFYYNEERDRLYIGTDPTGREVRASSLVKAISIRSEGVRMRGINVRRYAPSVPHMGAVTVTSRGVRLEDLAIAANATTGLHIAATDVTVRDVLAERNGMMGISGTAAHRLRLERVLVRRNNVERFNTSPSAGGVKIGRSRSVTVRDSEFTGNHGTGLWFDESAYDLGVFSSVFSGNAKHGLSIEVSGLADVVGNLITENGGNGIKINDTSDVQVWNNTLIGNHREINIVQDGRDTDPAGSHRDHSLPLSWQIRHIAIRNNVLSDGRGDTLIGVEDFTGRFSAAALDVTALGNAYHRSESGRPGWIAVWSRGTGDPFAFKDLAHFRQTARQELPGVEINGRSILDDDLRLLDHPGFTVVRVAQPLPRALAERAERPVDERRLGTWMRRGPE